MTSLSINNPATFYTMIYGKTTPSPNTVGIEPTIQNCLQALQLLKNQSDKKLSYVDILDGALNTPATSGHQQQAKQVASIFLRNAALYIQAPKNLRNRIREMAGLSFTGVIAKLAEPIIMLVNRVRYGKNNDIEQTKQWDQTVDNLVRQSKTVSSFTAKAPVPVNEPVKANFPQVLYAKTCAVAQILLDNPVSWKYEGVFRNAPSKLKLDTLFQKILAADPDKVSECIDAEAMDTEDLVPGVLKKLASETVSSGYCSRAQLVAENTSVGKLLKEVSDNCKTTKMSSTNLNICFAP